MSITEMKEDVCIQKYNSRIIEVHTEPNWADLSN